MQSKMKARVYERGQAMIIAVVLFLAGTLILLGGIAVPVLAEIRMVNDLVQSKQSLFIAEGALEDAAFRLKEGMDFTSPEVLSIGSGTATVTTQAILDQTEIVAVGDRNDRIRKMKILLTEGIGVSFHYGIQTDTGGIFMENNSSVRGSVYSNGAVIGQNSNLVRGEVVSAGPDGLLDGIHATSSGYAHTIQNSYIDGDAYYQVIDINTTVLGTKYPVSADQPTTTMPISDEMIEEWKAEAEAGGVISTPCPYEITDSITLPPIKIACDLKISGNPTVTINGPVWVEGDVNFSNTATVQIDPSLEDISVPIVADNPANRLTSSKIIIQNSIDFIGAGGTRSYVFLISQNNSNENGGSEVAINIKNFVSGDLLVYAGHGEVLLENNISLKEVSAYRVHIKNFAEVVYETGLANLLFTAGPSGGFVIDDWREVE